MSQLPAPLFGAFIGLDPSTIDETIRVDFASVVCDMAAASTSPDDFVRELNRQLAQPSIPCAKFLARGAERDVLRLPFGLVAKVEYSKSRKRTVEASANFAEWRAATSHPEYFPKVYGYHGHFPETGALVSVLIVEQILPLERLLDRFAGVATDSRQLRNVGVRFDTGALLIADGGDYIGSTRALPATPYAREWKQ